MKNLRNLMAWITLVVVLTMGTFSANAGVLLGDRSSDTCGDTKTEMTLMDLTGIVVAGITGIVVAGRDGIVVAGREGIVVAGREGIVVAGREGCQ